VKGGGERPQVVTCFTCGKEGHRSPECPSKKVGAPVKKTAPTSRISLISTNKKSKANVVWGKVNGVSCKVLVDSGAEIAMVPR